MTETMNRIKIDPTNKAATREAYGKTLVEMGKESTDIVVLDADLSGSTQTKHFAKEFPERFFNMGIAESNMVCTAAGLARGGKIPYASSFAMFAAGRAWELVRNSVAHNYLNVNICATHSGITVGEDGATHQIIEDIAIMRVIPTMNVFVPADSCETAQIIRTVAKIDAPCYVRLGRAKVPEVTGEIPDYTFEPGKANILKEGKDVTIIACGVTVAPALEAAYQLEDEHGISAEVINCASIKPLDSETIAKSASKTGKVLTVEEHNVIGGLGDAVASVIAEDVDSAVKLKKQGIQDCFGQSGKAEDLLDHYGLNTSTIVELSKALV